MLMADDEEEGNGLGSRNATDAGDDPDYTIGQLLSLLKEELKSRDGYNASEVNSMRKAALIQALEEDDIGEESSDNDEESNDEE
eukprot:CAMPEP_0181024098 /NCGR_PEP_ID=MMETSP1070-20121207/2391_1 /TAXON_ID=265543 /ORGANISM="Minutocellus polymorphus, Strain NH13" /LENGTH=83 /DNA_ID=CAMNT_0023101133 /DNA_START=744 /DNA_END=996 /DNA_ORIENTATION=-